MLETGLGWESVARRGFFTCWDSRAAMRSTGKMRTKKKIDKIAKPFAVRV